VIAVRSGSMKRGPFGRNDRRNERVARERALIQSGKLRTIAHYRVRSALVWGGIAAPTLGLRG
jgi:hypothetical protein